MEITWNSANSYNQIHKQVLDSFKGSVSLKAVTLVQCYLFGLRLMMSHQTQKKLKMSPVLGHYFLYIFQLSCSNMQTAMAFLCTRLTQPFHDDWKKFRQTMQYLYRPMNDKLTIGRYVGDFLLH